MNKVGIDALAFYTAHAMLDLADLAAVRQVEPAKFQVGLGQYKMSVAAPSEDIVTLAANAAARALRDIDKNTIEMVLFATESGIDQSKAAGIYVHHLLNLPERCRIVELKQACYSATIALQLALPFLQQNPKKKILLIAADIARYGLNTAGESSQGCGAVAMVLSAEPRIIAFEPEYGVISADAMDFWRPNYKNEAFVEGKYSSKLYLNMLEKTWQQYVLQSGRGFAAHDYYCYHTPVPRLVEKAHQYLAKINGQDQLTDTDLAAQIGPSLEYGRQIGNSYTASLYVSLAALLDLVPNLAGKRIGFYSYGSGCVAEYFSGVVQPHYAERLDTQYQQKLLANRRQLTYAEYENFYSFAYPEDGGHYELPPYPSGQFRLAAISGHKRIYEKVNSAATANISSSVCTR